MDGYQVEGVVNAAYKSPCGVLGSRANARAIIATEVFNVLRSDDLRLERLTYSIL
jgi:hypothetical protein